MLSLYSINSLAAYDPFLFLLTLRLSKEDDWSRYGVTNPAFLSRDFETVQVFDVAPLRAKNRSETGLATVIHVPGRNNPLYR